MATDPKSCLALAREAYAERDWARAEQLLRDGLPELDTYPDVHNMLGVIAHARGNLLIAERHLERAIELNPHYTEAALNLTVTYNDRGKYEQARTLHAKVRNQAEQPCLERFARGRIANMHAEVAQAYVDARMPREAIRELEKAVALAPEFADLQTRLAAMLRENGEPAAARAHYLTAIARRPSYVPAHLGLGVTLLALGDIDGARAAWHDAQAHDPDNAQARMYLRTIP